MKKAKGTAAFWSRYQKILGEDFEKFQKIQQTPLPKTIRVNLLKNSVEEFLSWQAEEHPDWKLVAHIFSPDVFFINREDMSIPLGKTLGHHMGRFYVQEASSCLPPRALQIDSGQKILDMAAAPGSKTSQIAGLMNGKGLLIANEFSASRTKVLVFNLQKLGVPNGGITHFTGEKFGELTPNFFDRILIDAPCTGEGTLRKDRRAVDHWSEKKIMNAAKLQKSLIDSAFQALKPGGILVYSTCTLAPEENEGVVDFLEKKYRREEDAKHASQMEVLNLSNLFPGAEKAKGFTEFEGRNFLSGKKMLRVWPHLFNSEGFFVAAVQKGISRDSASFRGLKREREKRSKKWTVLSKGEQKKIWQFLEENYGYERNKKYFTSTDFQFLEAENKIWICHADMIPLLPVVGPERPGILLGKKIPEGIRLTHEFVLAFGQFFSLHSPNSKSKFHKNTMEISKKQALSFFSGGSIESAKNFSLPVILTYKNIPIGIGKNLQGKIKNSLPRNFVVPLEQ